MIEVAGSTEVGDVFFNEIYCLIAVKLISHCDPVLRNGGALTGVDKMVYVGKQKNKIYFLVNDKNILQ